MHHLWRQDLSRIYRVALSSMTCLFVYLSIFGLSSHYVYGFNLKLKHNHGQINSIKHARECVLFREIDTLQMSDFLKATIFNHYNNFRLTFLHSKTGNHYSQYAFLSVGYRPRPGYCFLPQEIFRSFTIWFVVASWPTPCWSTSSWSQTTAISAAIGTCSAETAGCHDC